MSLPTIHRPAVLIVSASLREARERRKIGLRRLAHQIGMSPARLSGVERATHIPHPADVAHILGFIGIGGAEYEQVMKVAKHVYDANFIAQYDAQAFSLTWTYEQVSDRIVEWAPSCLPDLLRPHQHYERALGADDKSPCRGELEPLERSVRQQAMQDGPRRYVFLIGEEAVRAASERVGADEQIQHLRTLASLPHVNVRIVPTTAMGLNPPPAFTLFEDRRTPVAVTFKHVHCTAYITEKSLLDEYLGTTKALQRQALSETAEVDTLNGSVWGRVS
jgi:transcriptional regulator with XRE-family HTH domain